MTQKTKVRLPFEQRVLDSLRRGNSALAAGETLPARYRFVLPAPDPVSSEPSRFRAEHCLTQQDLAGLLNVSVKTVESWEQGIRRPSGTALRLLQILTDPKLRARLCEALAQVAPELSSNRKAAGTSYSPSKGKLAKSRS